MSVKRTRHSRGFYEEVSKLPRPGKVARKPPVLGEYVVEKLLAKRKAGEKREYLVIWKDYSEEDYTWEPESHIPSELRIDFENPFPEECLIKSAKQQLALMFERGLKTPLMTTQTLELDHNVTRYLFPSLPSLTTRDYQELKEEDLERAQLLQCTERIILYTNKRRKIIFPVLVRLNLGKAP